MKRLFWLLKRISVMKPSEVYFRLVEQAQIFRMFLKNWCSIGAQSPGDTSSFYFRSSDHSVFGTFSWKEVERSKFDAVLENKIPLFGDNWVWDAPKGLEKWSAAPDTGTRWPSKFFHFIGFRAGSGVGDIRIVWEASRFQHFIVLSHYFLQESCTDAELEAIKRVVHEDLKTWMEGNPLYMGPHYVSSMECALRIIALSISLDQLRLLIDHDTWQRWYQLVGEHAEFIMERLSLHSSAGNHTLAETLGLAIAAKLYPEHKRSNLWLQEATSTFPKELNRQIDPDGVGIEQAPWYTSQILDYGLLYADLMKDDDPEGVSLVNDVLVRGLKATNETRRLTEGYFIKLGDLDSGYGISYLFDEIAGRAVNPASKKREYENDSYTVLSNCNDSERLSLMVDHGPLGMPPSYGHGHADALSVCVNVNGMPLFVDPGTYSYTGEPEQRKFFRSSKAHNVVLADGEDQATQSLIFMWKDPYDCEVEFRGWVDDSTYLLVARHNGYENKGITHRRKILFHSEAGILIRDEMTGNTVADLELRWNHRWNAVRLEDNNFRCEQTEMCFSLLGGECSIVHGSQNGGWYSPYYSHKEPIDTYCVSAPAVSTPHEFTTIITPHRTELELKPWNVRLADAERVTPR